MIAAMCPSCGEGIELREQIRLLHRMFRCPTCNTRLYITNDEPVQLQTFACKGLPFSSGDASRVWLMGAGARRRHAISSLHEHSAP